jgi:hypothetical protein
MPQKYLFAIVSKFLTTELRRLKTGYLLLFFISHITFITWFLNPIPPYPHTKPEMYERKRSVL